MTGGSHEKKSPPLPLYSRLTGFVCVCLCFCECAHVYVCVYLCVCMCMCRSLLKYATPPVSVWIVSQICLSHTLVYLKKGQWGW